MRGNRLVQKHGIRILHWESGSCAVSAIGEWAAGGFRTELWELAHAGWGIGREQAIRCIQAAVDWGTTLFDTANQYGAGKAERVLGEALEVYPRDRYLIATKLYFAVGDEPDQGLSAGQVEKQVGVLPNEGQNEDKH